MKRLTEKGFNYSDAAIVENMRMVTVSAAMNRLAAYEDTGLEPEEIIGRLAKQKVEDIFTAETKTALDKLMEYKTAEKEGRLLVLPCRVGDTVYRIVRHRVDVSGYRMEWEWETMIEAVKFRIGMTEAFGKTVFRTREAAEAKLKEMDK